MTGDALPSAMAIGVQGYEVFVTDNKGDPANGSYGNVFRLAIVSAPTYHVFIESIAGQGGADNARYQLNLYVAASNLTNHNNYVGYSGVITSPFFGQPTNVMNPRKVELGVRFGF